MQLITLAQVAAQQAVQPAPVPQAPATPAAAAAPEAMSAFDYIISAGPLSFVLVGLSFLALALIIRNILALKTEKLIPQLAIMRLEQFARNGQLGDAILWCNAPENDSLISRIVGSALQRCSTSPLGVMEFRAAVEDAGAKQVRKLLRLNDGLAILAAVGPMLGLLGTVIGMIGAFGAISALQGSARSNQLASFMSMALVNTAEGLVVAIPSTIAYSLFRRRIDSVAVESAAVCDQLTTLIEQAGARGRAAPRATAMPATPPTPAASVPAAGPAPHNLGVMPGEVPMGVAPRTVA